MLRRDVIAGSAKRIMIEYVDADGEASSREIMPIWLGGTQSNAKTFNATHLEAHCYTRRSHRTFLLRRIQSVSDPRTGEVFEVAEWFKALQLGDLLPLEGRAPAANETVEPAAASRVGFGPRSIAVAILIGYMIGRLRIIQWLLALSHQKWGRWL